MRNRRHTFITHLEPNYDKPAEPKLIATFAFGRFTGRLTLSDERLAVLIEAFGYRTHRWLGKPVHLAVRLRPKYDREAKRFLDEKEARVCIEVCGCSREAQEQLAQEHTARLHEDDADEDDDGAPGEDDDATVPVGATADDDIPF